MRTPGIIFVCLGSMALAACTQQQSAPIEYRGTNFYGKDAVVDRRGMELPKYSRDNPPPQQSYAADKYSNTVEYSVNAEIADVAEAELPPPPLGEPVRMEPPAASPFGKPSQSITIEPERVTAPAKVASLPPLSDTPVARTPVTPKFIWPVRGKVISGYGKKQGGQVNDGINIAARTGEPIRASADGTVVYASSEIAGYGNMAIVRHADGFLSAYAHASELVVKKGDAVVSGQLVGFVGKTGNVDKPQLHFSLRKDKVPVNPEPLLAHD